MSLQWPEIAAASQKGSQLERLVSSLSEMKWFTSPEANKSAAENVIHTLMNDVGARQGSIRWLDRQQVGEFI